MDRDHASSVQRNGASRKVALLALRCYDEATASTVFPIMNSEKSESSQMLCVCPECKNTLDLSRYPSVASGMVIECDHCGMTLLVKEISAGKVMTEIVDEGK
ncbi:MAG: hypothetical protein KGI59_00580 [Patescibacteria group bacterium]|nr:hypothetical protein [Patescibacteria group bacterium]MDE2172409.1 hypothetical protein [Patescibacteria group bacterium]